MQSQYLPLIAACLLSIGTAAVADEKSVPESFTKEEAALFSSIKESAATIFGSDKIVALKTPEQRIKRTFDQLVKSHGVGMRLVIAKAMADMVPEEFHGYVAKRALSYSPLKAKELLASLSQDGASASVNSALGVLPTASVHTADAASDGRVFQLPQVDARRRVTSRDGDDRLIGATGSVTVGGVAVAATATLGGVQDNGFTIDGLGYRLVDSNTGALIGTYLAEQENSGTGEITFYFKNTNAGAVNNGSGPTFSLVMSGVTFP